MQVNGYTIAPVANLRGADLTGADLRDANLWGANLRDADLMGADLRGAYLRDAILRGADLTGVDLRGADLWGANLRGAGLTGAILRDADLTGADLRGADLRDAGLRGADLRDADLTGAILRDADLRDAILTGAYLTGAEGIPALTAARLFVPPQGGAFLGYKKLGNGVVATLQIPAEAARSSATTRKCRAEFAIVLEGEGPSRHDPDCVYRVGETVRPHHWEPDRWQECAGGIHFFMTREEAEAY